MRQIVASTRDTLSGLAALAGRRHSGNPAAIGMGFSTIVSVLKV
jgi:hypothetical protein